MTKIPSESSSIGPVANEKCLPKTAEDASTWREPNSESTCEAISSLRVAESSVADGLRNKPRSTAIDSNTKLPPASIQTIERYELRHMVLSFETCPIGK